MSNFDISQEDYKTIVEIVDRATIFLTRFRSINPLDLRFDITLCHKNGTPLDLQELLNFNNIDFFHDILGIINHIDRKTGKLNDYFVPRCAKPKSGIKI